MNLFICILLGIVTAWAVKFHGSARLGLWRVASGAVAASFPHFEFLFIGLGNVSGVFWSLLLAPFYALIVSFAFAKIIHKVSPSLLEKKGFLQKLQGLVKALFGKSSPDDEYLNHKISFSTFYPVTIASAFVSVLFASFTGDGIQMLWPAPFFIHFNLLFGFDYALFWILLITIVFGFIFRKFSHDIARISLVIILFYLIAVITFHVKASTFADKYIDAFNLDVVSKNILPQPLSPLNWRLIIETADGRLHDTLINLFREKEIEISNSSTRATKIDAKYKPLDRAVWRIYKRYGTKKLKFVRLAVESQRGSYFDHLARFAVFKGIVKRGNLDCARFRDIRFEGVRDKKLGSFMICREIDKFVLYE